MKSTIKGFRILVILLVLSFAFTNAHSENSVFIGSSVSSLYDEMVISFELKDYDRVIEIYESEPKLSAYSDSNQYYYYAEAQKEIDNSEFYKASRKFKGLSDFKDSSLWSLLDSDDVTEDELDEYDKEMGDDAQAMFKQLQRFTTELENGKASFNEEKTFEEAKNTNVTEVVDSTQKVEEEDTAMAYVNAYEFLNQYEANNGKPLGEYLADIGNETSESADLRKLYPVLEPMSAAQRKMVGMSGILSIISTL